MPEYAVEFLREAHRQSSRHRSHAEYSDVCGCFYCLENFSPREITEWCDEDARTGLGQTAICPKCEIDSVLFDFSGLPVRDPEFLRAMHLVWFSRG